MPISKVLSVLCTCFVATALLGLPKHAPKPAKSAAAPESSIANATSCDLSTTPAATLLLPYFEVDIHNVVNDATNTIFSIINTSRSPQIARVTVWSDQGFPVLWFNVFLTGYDVQSVSLYDVLANGAIPQTSGTVVPGGKSSGNDTNAHLVNLSTCASSGGNLPPSVLADVQSVLTTGVRSNSNCSVGGTHTHADGYATIDLVSSCTSISPLDPAYYSQVLLYDNVLTGDFERIAPERVTGNFAGGNPLVHIKAVPEGGTATTVATDLPYTFYDRFTPLNARRVDRRQPLPSSFAARFIQGGTGEFMTDFMIWREGAGPVSGCASANAAMPMSSIVRFDENENPTVISSASGGLPVASLVSTTSSTFPPLSGVGSLSGWMLLNLDNGALISPAGTSRSSQNWVVVHLSAEGRYGVDYDATSLANGCSPPSSFNIQINKGIQ